MEKPLTGHIRRGEMLGIEEYEKMGGYLALRKALHGMSPQDILAEVKASNLRGRGGAGFPTGMKWSFVPADGRSAGPKYLISNSDEMEPGTFKDRVIMEGNPHLMIEGMIIGSYAVQADIAYIFLRWAYVQSSTRLERALAEAYEKKYLGRNILGSGYGLEMRIHTSAGRYICGEETALLNALEGRRGIPRSKPPYPQLSGLWGKPAVVNNAETFANVPHIILNGADWYKGLSRSKDGGTKIYGISGKVRKPGWWELPMGTTLRELLEEHAGGMQSGFTFRGALPGGGSTDFITADHLDTRMDFDSLSRVGSRLGTGIVIVLDDMTCPVGMVLNLTRFFARESCGWCTPCWAGLQWAEEILDRIEKGAGRPDDLDLLAFHCRMLAPGHTYCAHAPGAMEPVQSALKYFREDFERHIRERKCPFKNRR
ncbi:MAG: NADH-quinone oxidoreductase subunit NuoF [Syntrophales bacterium]